MRGLKVKTLTPHKPQGAHLGSTELPVDDVNYRRSGLRARRHRKILQLRVIDVRNPRWNRGASTLSYFCAPSYKFARE